MTIDVDAQFLAQIRQNPYRIVIQVQDSADPHAALAGLREAARTVSRLGQGREPGVDGGSSESQGAVRVFGPIATGRGPYIMVDAREAPESELVTIPDLVVQHVTNAGVEQARIVSPASGALWGMALDQLPRAVTLRAYPPPKLETGHPPELPAKWLDEARAWVCDDLDEARELWSAFDSMQLTIAVGDAAAFLDHCRCTRPAGAFLLAGDLGNQIRGSNASLWWVGPTLALAYGGPASTDDELLAAMEKLKEIARRIAPEAATVFVSLEPRFGGFANITHQSEFSARAGGAQGQDVKRICDEIVLDAYPYQVLGPGHLRRLGGVPPDARALPGGRVEVSLGEPASWLLLPSANGPNPGRLWSSHRRDPGVQKAAREVLAPCLLSEKSSGRYLAEREAREIGSMG